MSLDENKEIKRQDGEILSYEVKENEDIYKGALVVVDDNDGKLKAGEDADDRTFVGVAVEPNVDQVLGEEQDKNEVRVFKTGVFELNYAGTAKVGETAYLADDETINTAHGSVSHDIAVGYVVAVDSENDNVRVRIDNAVDATEVLKEVVES